MEEQSLVGTAEDVEKKSNFSIEFTNDSVSENADSSIRNNKANEIYEVIKNDRVTPNDYFRDTRSIHLKTNETLRYTYMIFYYLYN